MSNVTPLSNLDSEYVYTRERNVINITKSRSKDFNSEFIAQKITKPASLIKWELSFNIDKDQFFQSLCLTKNSINDPALSSTQFKVIHNITNCNSNLFK